MEGRVLIVENDPTVLKLATDFLQYDGHNVKTAGDGEEGLKVFSSGEFDVVVTDVKMPKMDGIEMMKAMKALDPSIEVIVLTGYGTFEMTIEVIRNGTRYTGTFAPEKCRPAIRVEDYLPCA